MTRERVKEQMILMGRVRSMLAQRPGLGSLTATSINDEVSISMPEAYPCSSLKTGGKMWTQTCERMEHWTEWTLIPHNTPWPYHLPCNPLHPAHHLIGRCASPPASTLPYPTSASPTPPAAQLVTVKVRKNASPMVNGSYSISSESPLAISIWFWL